MTQKLQGYGQPQDWDDETYYPIGQSVAHNGAMWRAVTQNRNSEPGVDNANWTLVLGGAAFVTRIVTPNEYQTLDSAPIVIVPAPVSGTIFIQSAWVEESSGTSPTNSGDDFLTWDFPGAVSIVGAQFGESILGNSIPGTVVGLFPNNPTTPVGAFDFTAADIAQTAVVWSAASAVSGGTASYAITVFYTIIPPPIFSTFFTISAVDQTNRMFTVAADPTSDVVVGTSVTVVGSTGNDGTYTVTVVAAAAGPDNITVVNQGTKKFTIAGDHHTEYPAGSIATVAGSTGNDGVYTVVSAVFGTATVITVVEAIPNATADGTIEMTNQIVVSQAIPDSTADGFVEAS